MEDKTSMFHNAPPKLTFMLGTFIGISVVSTVGLFITLSMLLGDGGTTKKTTTTTTGTVAGAGTNTAAAPVAPTVPDTYVVPEDGYAKGDPEKADIVLVEYSDYECPFCKSFHPTMQSVLDKYGDKVAWMWRHYPLSFHANAQKEAEAAECAGDQGGADAFWEYSDLVMSRTTSNGTGFALTSLVPLAKEIGLDEADFQDCLDSGKFASRVAEQMAEGTAAGVSGTPGTILVAKNGTKQLIEGALPAASITSAIDAVLAAS